MADRPAPRHGNREPQAPLPRSLVFDTSAAHTAVRRRLTWRTRTARRTTRFLRSKRGRWVLIGLACIAVIAVGLLSQGYLGSPAPSTAGPDVAAGSSTAPGGSNTAAGSTGQGSPTGAPATGYVDNPVNQLRGRIADNPLNHLRSSGVHSVIIEATSSRPIKIVGYLVPTGLSHPYGAAHPDSRSFRLVEQAVGPGYLAAVFVQAGPTGAPITCRVIVDGRLTNAETTQGVYGRTVCLG